MSGRFVRVSIEVTVLTREPRALIARAREAYARTVGSIDVDGMTTQEALAVCDLTRKERHAHPRYVTPRQKIPDVSAAVTEIVDSALSRAGAIVESTASKRLSYFNPKTDLRRRLRDVDRWLGKAGDRLGKRSRRRSAGTRRLPL